MKEFHEINIKTACGDINGAFSLIIRKGEFAARKIMQSAGYTVPVVAGRALWTWIQSSLADAARKRLCGFGFTRLMTGNNRGSISYAHSVRASDYAKPQPLQSAGDAQSGADRSAEAHRTAGDADGSRQHCPASRLTAPDVRGGAHGVPAVHPDLGDACGKAPAEAAGAGDAPLAVGRRHAAGVLVRLFRRRPVVAGPEHSFPVCGLHPGAGVADRLRHPGRPCWPDAAPAPGMAADAGKLRYSGDRLCLPDASRLFAAAAGRTSCLHRPVAALCGLAERPGRDRGVAGRLVVLRSTAGPHAAAADGGAGGTGSCSTQRPFPAKAVFLPCLRRAPAPARRSRTPHRWLTKKAYHDQRHIQRLYAGRVQAVPV